MRKASTCLFLCATALCAQTADIAFFRAVLSPANETPPIADYNAKGIGDVVAHLVRDASGKIVSGSVDFLAHPAFPADVTTWVREGKLKFREDIVEGLENAPTAFIGLLQGKNFGKMLVRVGEDKSRR